MQKVKTYKASCKVRCNNGLPFDLAVIYCATEDIARTELKKRIDAHGRDCVNFSTGPVQVREMH